MIRQVFDIEDYWKVIVYYNVDYTFFPIIAKELEHIGTSREAVDDILHKLKSGEAKGVTCSSLDNYCSIILFGRHHSRKDYIDSIVHEAEHVKQAMLSAYHVADRGEPPAYAIGYIVAKMYNVFGRMVCNYSQHHAA